jgi:hypothetical protein
MLRVHSHHLRPLSTGTFQPVLSLHFHSQMGSSLLSSKKKKMDPSALFSATSSCHSQSQMAFNLQPAIERQTKRSDSYHIRHIIVCNGIARIVSRSPLCGIGARRNWMPQSVKALQVKGGHWDELRSITFKSDSRLTQIGLYAFSFSSLSSIMIPRSVEVLGLMSFASCQ